ncbi:MAG: hypothetical protein Q9208_006774 [Pyrenodesmia sp. 3 TL-2023]
MMPTTISSFGWMAFVLWLPSRVSAFADMRPENSFAEDLREFLVEDVDLLDKRSSTRTPRLMSYTWAPPASEVAPGFNISMDASGCGESGNKSTIAGIYTYSNGTTADDVTVGDILADLKEIMRDAPNLYIAENVMSKHTLAAARTVQATSNKLLDGGLLCKTATKTSSSEIVHNELRRLLWLSPETRREMLFLVRGSLGSAFASAIITAVFTLALSAIGGSPDIIIVGLNAFVAAVSTFISTLSAGIVEYQARRRRIRAIEAFPAAVSLAVMRRAIQDFEARLARAAVQSAAAASASTSSSFRPGGTGTSSSSSFPTPSPAASTCVDPNLAVDLANSLGDLLLPQDVPQSDRFGWVPRIDLELGIQFGGVC